MIQLSSPFRETPLSINGYPFSLTASRYLLSPTRSRYLRQNGNDPKFFVIVLSKDFAVSSLLIRQMTANVKYLAREYTSVTMPWTHRISWRNVIHRPSVIAAIVSERTYKIGIISSYSFALDHSPAASRTKCLDGKVLAFLHFGLVVVFH